MDWQTKVRQGGGGVKRNSSGVLGGVLGGVQVICNMTFLMLWKGHGLANQSAPGGGGGEAKF